MEYKIYVIGGKLGDFVHMLYVVKVIYMMTNTKGIVYITNDHGGDAFSRDLQSVYQELVPILQGQDYIHRFAVLDDPAILEGKEYTNLNTWREWLGKNNGDWLTFLARVYKIPRVVCAWLTYKKDVNYINTICLHHSRVRYNAEFPWEKLLKRYNACRFITCSKDEYDNFPFKHLVTCDLLHTLEDMFIAINSCKLFIGNQSSPAAIAVALGKHCIISLYPVDASFYMQTDWCKGKCQWYLNKQNKYLEIEKQHM